MCISRENTSRTSIQFWKIVTVEMLPFVIVQDQKIFQRANSLKLALPVSEKTSTNEPPETGTANELPETGTASFSFRKSSSNELPETGLHCQFQRVRWLKYLLVLNDHEW